MSDNGWKRQYAIRMPNGDLYRHPVTVPVPDDEAAAEDFSIPSPARDMARYFATKGARPVTKRCPVCEGRGVIECADVYQNHGGPSFVAWELARVVACGCREGTA